MNILHNEIGRKSLAKMQKIIANQLEIDEASITLESSFRQDLKADSLDTYELVYAFEEELGIKSGECTDDGMFSIEACRCLGACGLAPVMTVDGEVYGKCTPESAVRIIRSYMNEED